MCVCVTSYTQTGCVRENDGCRDSRAMACKLQDQRSVISCTEFLASYPTHEGPNLPVPGSQFEPKLGSQNSWCRVYPWGDIQNPPRDHLEIHPWNPPLPTPGVSKHPCEPGTHTADGHTVSQGTQNRIPAQPSRPTDAQARPQRLCEWCVDSLTHSSPTWWTRVKSNSMVASGLRRCQH